VLYFGLAMAYFVFVTFPHNEDPEHLVLRGMAILGVFMFAGFVSAHRGVLTVRRFAAIMLASRLQHAAAGLLLCLIWVSVVLAVGSLFVTIDRVLVSNFLKVPLISFSAWTFIRFVCLCLIFMPIGLATVQVARIGWTACTYAFMFLIVLQAKPLHRLFLFAPSVLSVLICIVLATLSWLFLYRVLLDRFTSHNFNLGQKTAAP
jgi:hypothetical protein